MNISIGCLVLVCEYGANAYWFEVIATIGSDVVRCTNGHGEFFNVHRMDISDVSNDDDSVLK